MQDTWLYWYWGKENTVDREIPRVERLLRRERIKTVLDLGCGTGRHSIYLAKLGYAVEGFDQSRAAIARARALARKEKIAPRLRVWDMLRLPYPYPTSHFDAVIATKVIHHADIANIRRIAEEIARITRARGLVYLQVPTRGKAVRLREEEGLREIEKGTYLPLEGDEKGVIHHYFSRGELTQTFSEFEIKELRIIQEHYCMIAKRKTR